MNTRSNRTYAISLMALSTAFIASSAAAAPQVTASATQGTAPLSVRFDASGAAQSVADVDATWDFGDANASMFVDGHASATAHGAIAAHVFERPGSYDVLLELRDESGGVERRTLSVTVSAPMRTLCVSQDSNFAGCPGGAARLTTSSLASAALQFAEYDEVLLCRGESWNLSSTLNVTSSISIGAYGACQAPDAHGICVNAPRLETSGSTAIDLNASSDVRLADLALSGPSCSSCGSGVTGAGVQNALLQRLRIDGFATGISFDTSSMTNRDLHVVGCDVGGAHASQITVAADGLVLLLARRLRPGGSYFPAHGADAERGVGSRRGVGRAR